MRGLPTSASHVLWRTREAEAAYEPLCVSASPISFRSKRPVDCHNSNLASFYFAFVHHSTRANSTPAKPKPSLARQDTEKPRSRLLRRTEHKPLKSVIRNPGKRHQRPCSGSQLLPRAKACPVPSTAANATPRPWLLLQEGLSAALRGTHGPFADAMPGLLARRNARY